MKKFLCYDTNDAVSGKINVDNRGMLKPNSTVPSTNGTPYQQLVTDGNGNTQWEDRLAYEATEEQVIFSQENIAFSERNGKYGAGPLDMPETISVGEKVRVDFDGETYDCIAYNDPLDSRHTVHIGNGFIIGLPYDTGEPFVILNPTGPTEIMIVTNLTNPSHTVSITKVVETVHKLPQKFLPDPTVFYYNADGRLVDAEGVEMTLEQAKAVGLNFIIQSDSSVARPISALYGDDYVSFYVAEVINESAGTVALDNVYVGTPPLS